MSFRIQRRGHALPRVAEATRALLPIDTKLQGPVRRNPAPALKNGTVRAGLAFAVMALLILLLVLPRKREVRCLHSPYLEAATYWLQHSTCHFQRYELIVGVVVYVHLDVFVESRGLVGPVSKGCLTHGMNQPLACTCTVPVCVTYCPDPAT